MCPTDLSSLSPRLRAFLENPQSPYGSGSDKDWLSSVVLEMIADLEQKILGGFSIPPNLEGVSPFPVAPYWRSPYLDWS